MASNTGNSGTIMNKTYPISEGSIENLEDILAGNKVGPDILVEDNSLVTFNYDTGLTPMTMKIKAEFVGIISWEGKWYEEW